MPKGSGETLKRFVQFISSKKHASFEGYYLGDVAVGSWIKQIKEFAAEEEQRIVNWSQS